MKFLKTIQKNDELAADRDEFSLPVESDHSEEPNQAAGVLSLPELRIGAPRAVPGAQTTGADSSSSVVPEQVVKPEPLVPAKVAKHQSGISVNDLRVNVETVNPRVVAITQPRSPYCEEYRNLRTQILHKSRKRKLQTIVIASVGPSEGKSVTALNLSWMFAQADGVRVLIIDSDLRRPSLAGYLGVESGSGLSEVLTGGASLMSSIVRLQPAGLYMLEGGQARSDVAELISGPKFSEILDEARQHFDFIIIDAPPLGIFTDASLLINQTDGALLVIRANHTKYKDVDRVLENLPRERMLGTVLNQSEVPLMDESYYNYSLYGSNEPVKA